VICLTLLFVAFTYADDDDDDCYCETDDGVPVEDGCDCNADDNGEDRNLSLERSDRQIVKEISSDSYEWKTNKKSILCCITFLM
jgi:hypothetical protein